MTHCLRTSALWGYAVSHAFSELPNCCLVQVVEDSPTIDMTSLPQLNDAARWLPIEMIYDDEPTFPSSLKADITMWALTALEVSIISFPPGSWSLTFGFSPVAHDRWQAIQSSKASRLRHSAEKRGVETCATWPWSYCSRAWRQNVGADGALLGGWTWRTADDPRNSRWAVRASWTHKVGFRLFCNIAIPFCSTRLTFNPSLSLTLPSYIVKTRTSMCKIRSLGEVGHLQIFPEFVLFTRVCISVSKLECCSRATCFPSNHHQR